MPRLVSAMLVVAGFIHLLALPGVLGGARLAALYGLPFDDPNLAILMRHRAVLFGLLGLFLCFAAFRPALRPLALAAGLASAGSFLLLATLVGGQNAQLTRVFTADVVAVGCLALGTVAELAIRRRG